MIWADSVIWVVIRFDATTSLDSTSLLSMRIAKIDINLII